MVLVSLQPIAVLSGGAAIPPGTDQSLWDFPRAPRGNC